MCSLASRAAKIWWYAGHYEPDFILSMGPDPKGFTKRPDVNKAVGAVLALGHDDVCNLRFCPIDQSVWEVRGAHGIYEPPADAEPTPSWRNIPDYCPIRHRVAIVRLIRAINRTDPFINSATRMWTLTQMAVHLDLADVVRDQVAQWFLASPNTKFIELFPEESFAVALSLRIHDVLITAFQILVNEFAIDYADGQPASGGSRPNFTWTLRKRGDYGDFLGIPSNMLVGRLLIA